MATFGLIFPEGGFTAFHSSLFIKLVYTYSLNSIEIVKRQFLFEHEIEGVLLERRCNSTFKRKSRLLSRNTARWCSGQACRALDSAIEGTSRLPSNCSKALRVLQRVQ